MHKIIFHLRDSGEGALGRDFSGSSLCCCLSLSHVWLLCAPMDCSPPVHPWDFPGKNTGVDWHFFLQGNLPDPSIELMFLALAGGFFTAKPPGKPCFFMYFFLKLRSRPHGNSHSPSPIFQKESIPLMCPYMLPWAIKISEGSRWRHNTVDCWCGELSILSKKASKISVTGTSLVVHGPRLHTPNAGGLGLIPVQGARSHLPQK